MNNLLFVGSDHAGFAFKNALLNAIKKEFPKWICHDEGCFDDKSCDYPDFAEKVGLQVVKNFGRGILVCGSGIGVAIAANKIPGIRAATVWDSVSAKLSKEHNNTNIICFGARLVSLETAMAAASLWLRTDFESGRHQRRIDLITALEKKYGASKSN
jgi:ribose 5-phosphate isomerase B